MADLYAIVGDIGRAGFMLECGVPYLQLRFKERPLEPYRAEIGTWRKRYPTTRVIVNDDLALAVSLGVWGAHLGQEDLARHDLDDVRRAPLCVGISTHDDSEIGGALDCGAALLGFGPLFPTATKTLKHAPQGAARLAEVVRRVPVAVAAIGGITAENLDAVADTGVAMVAMIAYLDGIREPAALHALMRRLARPGISGPP